MLELRFVYLYLPELSVHFVLNALSIFRVFAISCLDNVYLFVSDTCMKNSRDTTRSKFTFLFQNVYILSRFIYVYLKDVYVFTSSHIITCLYLQIDLSRSSTVTMHFYCTCKRIILIRFKVECWGYTSFTNESISWFKNFNS